LKYPNSTLLIYCDFQNLSISINFLSEKNM